VQTAVEADQFGHARLALIQFREQRPLFSSPAFAALTSETDFVKTSDE